MILWQLFLVRFEIYCEYLYIHIVLINHYLFLFIILLTFDNKCVEYSGAYAKSDIAGIYTRSNYGSVLPF